MSAQNTGLTPSCVFNAGPSSASMATTRQRAAQPGAAGSTDAGAATAAAAEQQPDAVDPVRTAKVKTLLLRASAVVLAAVVLAYFELISDKMALAVIVLMYVTTRLFS
ncbi:hypothetical protein COO60DRAFT_1639048 [Scenedesmus sp. NREL 46B-D3]|nr:hypothetical protein COO60DRAFT_1639048 [Scenedesmus sp. NREL 46B-D3]